MYYSPAEEEIRLKAYFHLAARDMNLTKQIYIIKELLEHCSFLFFRIQFYILHIYLRHKSGHSKVVLSKNIVVGHTCIAM